ncbi:hypothetical protein [Bradyrhizobium uaiense]|uniref:Uncharacterized protein n=1 Tax=Bradyrhizobium uaiense TaxID=2594946 RepID=A0A6P1B971_9BRAD|nr:hypothetical protein [Bradyrhizobium uaiense]NEU95026.1 hypothetical protein [Bradyrhizobium uaiense]
MEMDRTSALGLFNTARSYWRSAVGLQQLQLKVTHPSAPVTFLFCHGIELYLKSLLRLKNYNLAKLKGIGHNISRLGEESEQNGLVLSAETRELLSHIKEEDVAMDARYIVTGFKSVPTAEALFEACTELDKSISEALRAEGQPVHQHQFADPPPPPVDLDDDTLKVLVYLFKLPNSDHSDSRYISGHLGIDRSYVKYHLDQLSDREFAILGGFSMDTGDQYWSVTPKGRAYVVRNKLA